MDRYDSHTRHCRSCRQAHGRIRRWRPRLAALAVAVPLLALAAASLWNAQAQRRVWLVAGGLAAGLLTLGGQRQLERWQRGLEQGSGDPPRNRQG